MLICLGLFLIGFIEEFIAVIYYGFIRKGWKIPCAVVAMIRNIVWLAVSATVLSSFLESAPLNEKIYIFLLRGASHTVGVGIGNYISLAMEHYFEKFILKLNTKGRRKKRWYIQKETTIKT